MNCTILVLSAAMLAPASTPTHESADEQARVSDHEYIFGTGDTLEGDNFGEVDTHIRARANPSFPSMVLIRASFVDRIHDQAKDM